ncbi:MAG: hypothetical protein KF819_12550, partial [Labilithrix sp.]|nr:hypothetical protein [Labilithrix sp.]
RVDPLGAFRYSSDLTRGVRWRLFLFGVLLAALNVVGAFLLGVGLIVTIPISAFAMAHVYRRLGERYEHDRVVVIPEPVPA